MEGGENTGGRGLPRPPARFPGDDRADGRGHHRTVCCYFRTVTFLASTKPLLTYFTWVKYTPRETVRP